MKSKNNLENIFKELVKNGKTGTITIPASQYGNWKYYSKFYTKIGEANNIDREEYAPVINIHNYTEFLKVYEEYINIARNYYSEYKECDDYTDKGFDKYLTYTLFVNCTNYDFENFTEYVKKRTELLKNADNARQEYLTTFNNHKLYIRINKLPPNLEAPTQFTPILKNEDGSTLILPSISYGFYNDIAYIASVQGENGKQLGEASRIMDRYFRKLNKGIDFNSIDGEVSPNALASLTIFNAYIKSKNINKIVAPSFMPLRASASRSSLYASKQTQNIEALNKELLLKDLQQYRATNKFMYLFPRYCTHFTKSEYFFDETTEEMKIILKHQPRENNNIIYELDKTCYEAFSNLLKNSNTNM